MNMIGRFPIPTLTSWAARGGQRGSEFGRMFDDAAKRKFDVVLFWSLDRFTREGIQKTIFYLQATCSKLIY